MKKRLIVCLTIILVVFTMIILSSAVIYRNTISCDQCHIVPAFSVVTTE